MELLRRQYLGCYSIRALKRNRERSFGSVTWMEGMPAGVKPLFLDTVSTDFLLFLPAQFVWQYEPCDADRAGGIITSTKEQRVVALAMGTICSISRD
jgi:hypothetical protein